MAIKLLKVNKTNRIDIRHPETPIGQQCYYCNKVSGLYFSTSSCRVLFMLACSSMSYAQRTFFFFCLFIFYARNFECCCPSVYLHKICIAGACPHVSVSKVPDPPLHNLRASKSVELHILCSSNTSIDG